MSDNPNSEITLTNGAVENLGAVKATLLSLHVMKNDPITFYDVAELARDPTYKIFEKPKQMMQDFHFINSMGKMHDTIRNVILCAVKGEDFGLYILPLDQIVKK
jgi:hypothetical protein